ncbi:hypothetical protein ACUNWD_17380 [Sunxiuqinia sp. A32]|uniref:hypothetical protein n=1 Tax=Sunxiuqinia sp. A32 TaxID=3461496 RepID=UPI004045B83A
MKNLFLFVALMLFIVSGAIAQEEMKASKYENATWHEVVLVDFKPGKIKRAKEIIQLYEKAGQAAETTPPKMLWLMTGEYDMMLIWTLEDGPSEYEWKWSPDGVKWWKEFVKQQGSEEAANKLSEEYSSLVFKSTSYLARKDL